MLKNIRLHIEKDEEKQSELELAFAPKVSEMHNLNVNAFQRNIPSLLPYILENETHNISVFANKLGKANIVDYGMGRVFYGFDPDIEVQKQVEHFCQHALSKSLTDKDEVCKQEVASCNVSDLVNSQLYSKGQVLPEKLDVLVMLGLGLGTQIELLLSKTRIKHLIIYEPELQYFKCSTLATNWKHIFELSKKTKTALYMQIGKDGRNVISDIEELRAHCGVDSFYLFQHYSHPVFNSIVRQCVNMPWSRILKEGISYNFKESSDQYCPPWNVPLDIENFKDVHNSDPRFKANLLAFKQYFPSIYEEFKDYSAVRWLPVECGNGQINIINKTNLVTWYGEKPEQDCIDNFNNFSEQPLKDGLVLGYTGEKLKHYKHYRFVKETESILNELEEKTGVLPSTIKALIMFGVGSGYQLEHLIQSHDAEKLFICEPNRDFFYASLYAIDWQQILTTLDEKGHRLYINIGDDGSNLFRDLLNQFYAIGPYVLANTFFYQSYYNSSLNEAIGQLREQLQVVISMGEYYDHARYGIAHTREGVCRQLPHLVKKPSSYLSYEDTEVPVFFVGNGPSLDYSINTIKEWQDHAIIVSCGTALQVLCKNGICPDFHAEIEQNRSTFDWAARIENFDFLKRVNLLSCNGIHPDTADLYKNTYIAFKEGESSTVSTLNVLGELNFEVLQFAFPTVTNFAVNLFVKLGFKQLYLIGVDLGFKNASEHHSKQSGYFNQSGEALYNYAEKNNTSLVVPGNFQKNVFTKHEFKIAKIILEQSLASRKLECYNTSDGAKIAGATPLKIDNILLTTTAQAKRTSLNKIKLDCFSPVDQNKFSYDYEAKYSAETLRSELSVFNKVLASDVNSVKDAERIIEKQKEMLFASYQKGESLLFYYMYGTVNYANAFLSKVLSSEDNTCKAVESFNHSLSIWRKYCEQMSENVIERSQEFDASSAIGQRRINACLRHNITKKKVTIVCNSQSFLTAFDVQEDWYNLSLITTVLDLSEAEVGHAFSADETVIVYLKEKYLPDDFSLENLVNKLSGLVNSVFLCLDFDSSTTMVNEFGENVTVMMAKESSATILPFECQDVCLAQLVIQYFSIAKGKAFEFLIPKYTYSDTEQLLHCIEEESWPDYFCYDLGWVIGYCKEVLKYGFVVDNGSRANYLGQGTQLNYWLDSQVEDEFLKKNIEENNRCHPYILADEKYVSR